MNTSRSFDNGKYTVINNNGLLSALRYGEPWRELTGDNLVAAMLHEVDRWHEVNTELLEALQAALEALRGSAGFDEINNAKKQVKAAIAKATGEKV
jgi:hypothetical protein